MSIGGAAGIGSRPLTQQQRSRGSSRSSSRGTLSGRHHGLKPLLSKRVHANLPRDVVRVAEAARGDAPLALELLDVARLVGAVVRQREHLDPHAHGLREA